MNYFEIHVVISLCASQMARTQRNKATERHFGVLKAKLAKLRRELITPKGGSSGPGEGFDVAKTGDARIGFVGESGHQCTTTNFRISLLPPCTRVHNYYVHASLSSFSLIPFLCLLSCPLISPALQGSPQWVSPLC